MNHGEDEAALGAAIEALRAMISGPAGPRDRTRQPNPFHSPFCRIRTGRIRTDVGAGGMPWMAAFTLTEYRENADRLLARVDLHEVEIARELRISGDIARAWSTHEARGGGRSVARGRRITSRDARNASTHQLPAASPSLLCM